MSQFRDYVLYVKIEVGTPVTGRPLADPCVRFSRTGLLRETRKRTRLRYRVSKPSHQCKQGA